MSNSTVNGTARKRTEAKRTAGKAQPVPATPKIRKPKAKHMCGKCRPLRIRLDEPLRTEDDSPAINIVVHSTGTHPDMLLSRLEAMPYHVIITPGGRLFSAVREQPGITTINIALVGGLDNNGNPADTRTEAQNYALLTILTFFIERYPNGTVKGAHEIFPSSYPNPGFDVGKWMSTYIPAFIKAA